MFTLNNKKFFVHYGTHGKGNKVCRTVEVVIAKERVNKEEPLEVISTGIARCSKKDNFCKETGRKLALALALENAKLEKEERTQIWNKYFSRLSQ